MTDANDSGETLDLGTYVERVRVLNGHTSPETAYLVDDYPYGRVLRCKIRYWIETAKNTKQRFVSQTTNPKRSAETWNTPKRNTYSLLVVMYLNSDGHVRHTGISESGVSPEGHARMLLSGMYAQLTDDQRRYYDGLLQVSQRYEATWDAWEQKVTALAEHIRETGEDPKIEEGVWVGAPAGLRYLGTANGPVYIASARQRLTAPDA